MTRFDRLARIYDRIAPYESFDELAGRLDLRPDHVVVDVGGGTGQVAHGLRRFGARWILVDPSQGMLAKSRGREAAAVRGLGEALPVRNGSADRVVMVDALHHVRQADAVLAEIRRILRPDGRAVIQEFRMDRRLVRWLFRALEALAAFGSRFDTPQGWLDRFRRAGFDATVHPVSWRDVQFVLRPRP